VTLEAGLTTETGDPYNRLAMPVDDQAIVGAIRRQEERLARDPGSLAFAQLADLYRKAGRTREAVAVCRDGLARYPQYTTARLILAKALAGDGQLAPALAELRVILEMSPRDVLCHQLAAEVLRRLGHIDEAVQHLETAADLDPGRSPPDEFALRGREIYLHLPNGAGRSKLTIDYFERVLGVRATQRNWNTLLKLLALARP